MKFEQYDISDKLQRSIADAGFRRPTDIQYKSMPAILRGEDVLAIAQTGTGKTAAFAIPILNTLINRKAKSNTNAVRCVVMAPTHELALQLEKVFISLAKYTNLSILSIYGGVDQTPQKAKLNEGVDILIATPGRLFDLRSQGDLDLSAVEILILDEADHMLDMGFINDIRDLIKFIPKKRQTLFFSATINKSIKKLAYSLVRNAIRIQISPKDPVAKNIDHAKAFVEMDDKRFFLEDVIKSEPDKKILVFVRTKVRAERVKKAMERVEIDTDTIHSDKTQDERLDNMERFRNGELKILIATDVSARGIDIPNVDFVINYDLPETPENYVHRVGRTGRGDSKGQAMSFCSTEEYDILAEIEESLGKPINKMEISKTDYKNTIKISGEKDNDWQKVMGEIDTEDQQVRKKKNRKKRK
ncbi:MAG: ATP-dependent helicase [Bacteroidetes bacterium]|nr:MAG: ATP-dependent helicase [Bacteroidota bacterium]